MIRYKYRKHNINNKQLQHAHFGIRGNKHRPRGKVKSKLRLLREFHRGADAADASHTSITRE